MTHHTYTRETYKLPTVKMFSQLAGPLKQTNAPCIQTSISLLASFCFYALVYICVQACVCVYASASELSWIPEPVVTNSFEVPAAPGPRGDRLYPLPPACIGRPTKEKSKQAIIPRMNKPFLGPWLQLPLLFHARNTFTHTQKHSQNPLMWATLCVQTQMKKNLVN